MRFTTTVELARTTATGMAVPPEVVEALGGGRRPAVRVTLAGHTYRSTIASMGGRYLLPVSAEVRSATGVAAGDEVEVEVELDTAPRVVEVPPDLAEALAGQPGAQAAWAAWAAWAALSYSERRRHVLAVEGAKAAETRARRVAGVVAALTPPVDPTAG